MATKGDPGYRHALYPSKIEKRPGGREANRAVAGSLVHHLANKQPVSESGETEARSGRLSLGADRGGLTAAQRDQSLDLCERDQLSVDRRQVTLVTQLQMALV